MQYIVIEEISVEDLAKGVNKMIADGWRPQGGVSISLSESPEYQYYAAAQAMIKEDA